ncbi:MAG: DUF4422 domain-containing protein [Methanobacteriaceae archaeon]|nr:DUF4422 domain-containing protein [Methanobacteriaceae archaeon]
MNEKIKLFVISHSPEDIQKIKNDELYTPLFVGRNGEDNLGFISDDTGDNISNKNPNFCELTGLYWMWKHFDGDILGLCHYRRYFTNDNGDLIEKKDILNYLKDYDLIVPPFGTSLLGSVYNDYDNEHYGEDLDKCRKIISKMTPEYLDSYDKVIYGDKLCHYNMFIGSKELIDDYCNWVFPIMFELEKHLDASNYDSYRKRVYGFLTERLFNVWFTHKNLKVRETNVKLNSRILNFKMFFYKLPFLRWGYSHIYKPYIKDR